MSKRTGNICSWMLRLFLCVFMILSLFGCQRQEQLPEDASEDHGEDSEIIENDSDIVFTGRVDRLQMPKYYMMMDGFILPFSK